MSNYQTKYLKSSKYKKGGKNRKKQEKKENKINKNYIKQFLKINRQNFSKFQN